MNVQCSANGSMTRNPTTGSHQSALPIPPGPCHDRVAWSFRRKYTPSKANAHGPLRASAAAMKPLSKCFRMSPKLASMSAVTGPTPVVPRSPAPKMYGVTSNCQASGAVSARAGVASTTSASPRLAANRNCALFRCILCVHPQRQSPPGILG